MSAILKPKDDDFETASTLNVETVENGYIASFYFEEEDEEIKYIFKNKTELVSKILELL